jgi:hypothetical protein
MLYSSIEKLGDFPADILSIYAEHTLKQSFYSTGISDTANRKWALYIMFWDSKATI